MGRVIEAEGVKDDSHAWRVWMSFMQIVLPSGCKNVTKTALGCCWRIFLWVKRECEVTKTVNLALVIMQYEDVSVYMTHYSCQFLYTKGSNKIEWGTAHGFSSPATSYERFCFILKTLRSLILIGNISIKHHSFPRLTCQPQSSFFPSTFLNIYKTYITIKSCIYAHYCMCQNKIKWQSIN